MEKKLAKIVLAFLFAFPFYAQAVTFTSDANIQAGNSWMNVDIYDTSPNHTTVTMTGGSITDQMNVYNASTLNMSGGYVLGLVALENSTVNISGGSVGGLSLRDNATATISQNASIGVAGVGDSSVFNMNGGTIDYLGVGDNSIINLRGGTIIDYLGADFFATVNVFGYNLAKTDIGGTHGAGQVTGFWQDGSTFTINLSGTDTYSTINLIPEPATLLLLGIGTFLLRKSHK
ncbi:MAG: PEP-CTERM sorting domain-containing protein [Sedimentisphaerales bacterium]|jgi:hypothetical protein